MFSLGQIESALNCEVTDSYGGNYIAQLEQKNKDLEAQLAIYKKSEETYGKLLREARQLPPGERQ